MSASVTTVKVTASSRSYDVLIGSGVLDDLGTHIREISDARRVALITDKTVWALYGSLAVNALARAGFDVHEIVIEPGEASKSWGTAGRVLEQMASLPLSRNDLVVALGGGVVGDLAGFCAATYMRGIDFVQVPTTLLAQVDSSVGGKTGVDLEAGKNLAGAFLQPLLVVADTSVLRTLSDEDWFSGLAETVKMAILEGEDRLADIERNAALLRERASVETAQAVAAAVRFKAHVVSQDERESGVRECLNLGHTLGHAIEKVLGYGALPHGVAVGEGMRFAADLAAALPGGSTAFSARQCAVLDSLGLKTLDRTIDVAEIRDALRTDKKARDGIVRWVLPISPGLWRVEQVDGDTMDAKLAHWAGSKATRGC